MSAPLLHLATTAQWRGHLAAGAVRPPADVGFVHLSPVEQVHLPATRIFAGRPDLLLLVLDPTRIAAPVRWEPGVPEAAMRFPHAYGPVPTSAVTAVVPYRPRPDGRFDPPLVPDTSPAARLGGFDPSLLRRTATSEIPVTGGVAVLAAPVPASYHHNQLLVDGPVDAGELVAEADRTLGGAGLPHRQARLAGGHVAPTAAGLAARGWTVERLVGMVAPAGGTGDGRVEEVDTDALRPAWDARWQREEPGITAAEMVELADRYRLEEAVLDLRCLAIRVAGTCVASCLLKIDGGTALLDMVATDPEHRGRGHGDALLGTAGALAAAAGCDLVVLEAVADDWPRAWYGRRGFVEVGQAWTASRISPATTA